MKYMAYLTLVSKIFFLALIFFLIKSQDDYLLIPIINAVGTIISGSIALFIIFVKHKIQFKLIPFHTLKLHFFSAFPFFLSNLSIQVYVNANKLVIGTFLGMADVANYDLAEKIVTILKFPLILLNQTLFPRISRIKDINFVKKTLWGSTIFSIFLYLFINLFGGTIINILGGHLLVNAKPILQILSITIPLIAVSGFLSVQILIPFGFTKAFTKTIIQSVFIYLFLFFILFESKLLSLNSISLMTVLVEFFVLCKIGYEVKKTKILFSV